MKNPFKLSRKLTDFKIFKLSAIPLRVSLVVLITTITAVGLFASSLAVAGILNNFLINRLDNELVAASNSWASRVARQEGIDPNRPPSDFYLLIVHGDVAYQQFNSVNESQPNVQELLEPTQPVTVAAMEGSASSAPWRGMSVQNQDGSITIVALPMAAELNTIGQLLSLQLYIGILVLLVISVAAMVVVRRTLRPLNQVEYTASLISQGQLDQRIPALPANTEVGRLSVALNQMLAQIQHAFNAVAGSERAARRSEEAMRRFIGDASHELRTPLTSVRGYAELYQSGATNDADMVIEKISDESRRMSLLVEDLLALTRMEEGRQMIRERVDMLELVTESVNSVRAAFPGRTVNITSSCPNIPVVLGDVNRLHQVVLNLLTNGLRHGGEAAEVTVSMREIPAEDGETNQVELQISDNGQGISEEDLPHIFERFYRADVSRSRASGGSGLGLAIVKGLVEEHDGNITVESAVGQGTTFRVRLPAGEA